MSGPITTDERRDPSVIWPELPGADAGIASMIESAPEVTCQDGSSAQVLWNEKSRQISRS
jgi:hypothetical protein